MRQSWLYLFVLCALLVLDTKTSRAEDDKVDTSVALKVDKYCKDNPVKVRVLDDDTGDRCRGGQLVTIEGRDGKITLKPGQTRYFALPDKDDYNRSGGWYWYCSGTRGKSRLKGARYIKVIREADGFMRWYKIAIDPI
jgi:hypothetical protein